ncbi:hypothetical protein L1987_52313 [Smallanthus sonchifolius]|uniref:Uncharacterized protein n=1 Tax=Smallanthus sonchifolius TaxID=185202 RepID=A0ACB9ET31_9ASTR|nr:hypothetical protein L1987_52313 [Smallanthus sonchifolius]
MCKEIKQALAHTKLVEVIDRTVVVRACGKQKRRSHSVWANNFLILRRHWIYLRSFNAAGNDYFLRLRPVSVLRYHESVHPCDCAVRKLLQSLCDFLCIDWLIASHSYHFFFLISAIRS